jgi:hypothetical protein
MQKANSADNAHTAVWVAVAAGLAHTRGYCVWVRYRGVQGLSKSHPLWSHLPVYNVSVVMATSQEMNDCLLSFDKLSE